MRQSKINFTFPFQFFKTYLTVMLKWYQRWYQLWYHVVLNMVSSGTICELTVKILLKKLGQECKIYFAQSHTLLAPAAVKVAKTSIFNCLQTLTKQLTSSASLYSLFSKESYNVKLYRVFRKKNIIYKYTNKYKILNWEGELYNFCIKHFF